MMRQALLAKRAATHTPASLGAREFHVQRSRRFAFETFGHPQFVGGLTGETLDRLSQHSRAAAIHQAKLLIAVESKDRYFDFRHDLAQQRTGFERPQALDVKSIAKRVDF